MVRPYLQKRGGQKAVTKQELALPRCSVPCPAQCLQWLLSGVLVPRRNYTATLPVPTCVATLFLIEFEPLAA